MAVVDPALIAKAMTTPRFAALARADLSVTQIGTWDSALPRDSRLLVPIDRLLVDHRAEEVLAPDRVPDR